ncbi:MAG: nucleoside deaminase [Bacteroidales bacterium]|jgi:tRNA(adenine34) deaminase|nr:nucleoside deaminase [Bacteroidales bacterium]MDD4057678.1 nucleoside deaminase [Bacteroidales bacterium]
MERDSLPKQDDTMYMEAALNEALKALEMDEVPVGAVIVCDGSIVSRAYNMTERLNDPTAHAEMQAITMATSRFGGKYLERCTLYVTLEPCAMCASALAWSQIGRIVYGASDPKRGYSLFTPSLLHPKTTITGGIMEKECSSLIKEFFKLKR